MAATSPSPGTLPTATICTASASSSAPTAPPRAQPAYPAGKVKFDDTFQKNVETYRHSVTIIVPVNAPGLFTLNAQSQGCADAGLCYAPQDASARLMGNSTAAPALSGMPGASTAAPAVKLAPAPVRCRARQTGARVRTGQPGPLAGRRQADADRARLFPAGPGPLVHPLRVADDADPVVHHRGRGRQGHPQAGPAAVERVFSGHGPGLHGPGHCSRPGRPGSGRGLAKALGADPGGPVDGGDVPVHVRLL